MCPLSCNTITVLLLLAALSSTHASTGTWITSTVSESVLDACHPNAVSFTLRPSVPCPPSSRIVITGLTGTKTADFTSGFTPTPVVPNGFDASLTTWTKNTGTLTMSVRSTATILSTADFVISVELINPTAQAAVTPSISLLSSPLWAEMIPKAAATGSVLGTKASFFPATITESSPTPGQANTITFTFTPSMAIPSGRTITVAGLTGSSTGDATALAVGGTDKAKVGEVGAWTQSTGTLVLTVAASISATSTVLTIDLTNPSVKRAAVKPYIIAAAKPTWFAQSWFDVAVLGAGGGYWKTMTIHESTQTNAAANTITVTLMPSESLAIGDKVTITGLLNAQTGDNFALAVSGSSSSAVSNAGLWIQNTGTLTLTFASAHAKDTNFVCSMVLTNPAAGGTAVAGSVSASGVIMSSVLSVAVLGGTHTWFTTAISESVTAVAATNTLTILLKPSIKLPIGTPITITGLTQTTTADALTCSASTAPLQVAGAASAVVGRTGAWTLNTGTLVLTTAMEMPASDNIFTIALANLATESTTGGVSPTVSSAHPQASTSKPFTESVLGAGGGCWLVSAISEASQTPSADNLITLNLKPSVALASGTTITITNLKNSLTPSSTDLTTTGTGFAATGGWTTDATLSAPGTTGTLVLTSTAIMGTSAASTVTFTLKNPAAGMDLAVHTISAMSATPVCKATTLTGTILGASTWTTAVIHESIRRNLVLNTITVTIQPTRALPISHPVTITGLTSSRTADATLALVNHTNLKFAYTGSWTKNTGTLVVTTSTVIASDSATSFSFHLKNPGVGVQAVTAHVSSAAVPAKAMAPSLLGGTSFFTSASVSESSTTIDANNTITLTFKPMFDLVAPQKIRVSIRGLGRPSGTVVTGTNSAYFGGIAEWFWDEMVLTVATGQTVTAASGASITITVRNPSATRAPTAVTVQSDGPQEMAPFTMTGAVLGAGGGHFTTATLHESLSTMGTETMTFTFKLSVALGANAILRVSGFKWDSTGSYPTIAVGGTNATIFNSTATFDQQTYTYVNLKLTVAADQSIAANTDVIFSIAKVQPCTAYVREKLVSADATIPIRPATLTATSSTEYPRNLWSDITVTQSNSTPAADNSLSFDLVLPWSEDTSKGTITIGNLKGTGTPDSTPLEPFEVDLHDGDRFISTGVWKQLDGTLTFTVDRGLSFSIFFTIKLKNPSTKVESRFPTVSMSFPGYWYSPTISFYNAILGSGGYWVTASVEESSRVNNVANTLTFSFKPSIALVSGQKITIAGLTGSQTTSQTLAIAGTATTTVGSSGDWTQATGTLVLTLGSSMLSSATAELKVTLRNPLVAQAAVMPTVSASTSEIMVTETLRHVLGGTAAWTTLSVVESTAVPSAVNTLTFSVQPSVDLASGQVFSITGLVDDKRSDSDTVRCGGVKAEVASTKGYRTSWNQGILLVTTSAKLMASSPTVFMLTLNNSASPVPPKFPSISFAPELIPSQAFPPEPILGAGGGFWKSLAITESVLTRYADNILTLTFQPSIALAASSVITIRGLEGSHTISNSAFAISGAASAIESTANWDQGGTLKLTTLAINAGTTITITFVLNNGEGQEPRTARISASESFFAEQIVPGPVLGSTTSWDSGSTCSESSQAFGGLNTLTFSVLPRVTTLRAGTIITITNLKGSTTPSNTTIAIGGPAAATFGSTGNWDIGGTLTLTLESESPPYRIEFTLVLTNPATSRPGVTPTISASSAHMAVEAYSRFPHLVLAGIGNWTVATVSESSQVPNATNTLTFTLVPSHTMYWGQTFTIKGLTNTGTASQTLPILNSDNEPYSNTFFFGGDFNATTGTMILTIKSRPQTWTYSIYSSSGTVFKIILANPSAPRAPAVLTVVSGLPRSTAETVVSGSVLAANGGATSLTTNPLPTTPSQTPTNTGTSQTSTTPPRSLTPPPTLPLPPSCAVGPDGLAVATLTPSVIKVNDTVTFEIEGKNLGGCDQATVIHADDNTRTTHLPLSSVKNTASFQFSTSVVGSYNLRVLCQGHTYNCSVTLTASAPSKPIVMTFNLQLKDFAAGSQARKQFQTDLATGVASALGVKAESVCCITMEEGSVKVSFKLLASSTKTTASLEAAAADATIATKMATEIQNAQVSSTYPGAGVAPIGVSVDGQAVSGYVQPPKKTTAPPSTTTAPTPAPSSIDKATNGASIVTPPIACVCLAVVLIAQLLF